MNKFEHEHLLQEAIQHERDMTQQNIDLLNQSHQKEILAIENMPEIRAFIDKIEQIYPEMLAIRPDGLNSSATHLFLHPDGSIETEDMIVVSSANSNIHIVDEAEFKDALHDIYAYDIIID